MTIFDTHRAFTTFKDAGFSEEQAQALIDAGRDGTDALATKADLKALEAATKADLKELEAATKTGLRDLEQRMTIRLGTMLFASTGLQVAIVGILLVLIVR